MKLSKYLRWYKKDISKYNGWYDNAHLEYIDCMNIDDVKFEKVGNGIMLNCYPEEFVLFSPNLFKIIKEF